MGTTNITRPHLFMVLADDLGFAELNFERHVPSHTVHTPRIDSLVRSGIRLSAAYAFKYCSPSRSALISGRNPIHVNVNNFMPSMFNPSDAVSGYAGIPVNMTGIGTVMKAAGYTTVFAGKVHPPARTCVPIPPQRDRVVDVHRPACPIASGTPAWPLRHTLLAAAASTPLSATSTTPMTTGTFAVASRALQTRRGTGGIRTQRRRPQM